MFPHIDGEQTKLELEFSASLSPSAAFMHHRVDDVIRLHHDEDEEEEDEDDDRDDCEQLIASTTSRSSMTDGSGSSSSSTTSSGSNDSNEADVSDDYDGLEEDNLDQMHVTKSSSEQNDDLSKLATLTSNHHSRSIQKQNHPDDENDVITEKPIPSTASSAKSMSLDDQIANSISVTAQMTDVVNQENEQYNHNNASSNESNHHSQNEPKQVTLNQIEVIPERDQNPDSDVEVDEGQDETEDEDEEEYEDEEDEDASADIEDEEYDEVEDEEDDDDEDDDEEEDEEDDDDDEDSNQSQNCQENLYVIDDHQHYPLQHFNHSSHHAFHQNNHASGLVHLPQNHLSQHQHLHLGHTFEFDGNNLFNKCQTGETIHHTNHLQNNINHSNHQNVNNLHHPQYHPSNQHILSNHQHLSDDSSTLTTNHHNNTYYMTNDQQQHHEFQQQSGTLHHSHHSNNNDNTNDIQLDLIPQHDDCSTVRNETEICSSEISTSISSTCPTSNTIITSNSTLESSTSTTTKQSVISEDDIVDGERMLEVTRKLVRSTERDPDRDLRKQVLLKTAIKKLPHYMEYNSYTDSLDQSFHNQDMSQQHACYEQHDTQPKFYHSVQPNAIQMSTTSLRMLDLNDDQDHESRSTSTSTSTPTTTTTTTTDCLPGITTVKTDLINDSCPTVETSLDTNANEENFYHNTSHDSGVALFSPRSNKRSSSWVGLDDEMEIDNLTELCTRSQSMGSNVTQHIKKLRKREIVD